MVKEHVANNAQAHFVRFDGGNNVVADKTEPHLVYRTDSGFEFPIPLAETKDAVFNATEKAMSLLRWIRKEHEPQSVKSPLDSVAQ